MRTVSLKVSESLLLNFWEKADAYNPGEEVYYLLSYSQKELRIKRIDTTLSTEFVVKADPSVKGKTTK